MTVPLPETARLAHNESLPETPRHHTITAVRPCQEDRPHNAAVQTDHTTHTPVDETHQTKPQDHVPQMTNPHLQNSLNKNLINEEKNSERSLMDDDTFNLIRQKTPTKQYPRWKALQILHQEPKNNKMKYFIGGEHPTEADSGPGSDDVTDVFRNLFL